VQTADFKMEEKATDLSESLLGYGVETEENLQFCMIGL
jgi:hypothetical protein